MQQHLLHVAAKHGAAVVEPPSGDVWDDKDTRMRTATRVVELQMQGFEPPDKGTSTALLPHSFTPSTQ